jgi:CRP-like cAMP-binding protein
MLLGMLGKTPLFKFWPQRPLQNLLSVSHQIDIAAGKPVIRQGEVFKGLFVILSGSVEVEAAQGNGRQFIQRYAKPGTAFGFMSVFDAKSSPYSYIAHEQARLLFIRKADFIAVLTKNPSLWLSVAQHLADLLRVALDTVQEQTFEGVRARLARSLLSLAQSREQDTPKLRSLRYTQEDLAGLLGVSRQSISKQLKRLEREGLIRILYGKVELNDEDGLKHIAFN